MKGVGGGGAKIKNSKIGGGGGGETLLHCYCSLLYIFNIAKIKQTDMIYKKIKQPLFFLFRFINPQWP